MSIATPEPVPEAFDSYRGGLSRLLVEAASQYPMSGLLFASRAPSDDAELVSYPALLAEAQRILGGLSAVAGAAGTRIALLLEQPRDFIPTFWACVLGGYVPCPLAPIRNDADRWTRHVTHVNALLEQPLFIGRGELLESLPSSVLTISLDALRESPPVQSVFDARFSDAAILMLTSGSTGNSKAVELTHGNVLTSLAGRAKRQQLTHADLMFNWIAFDHVAALLESHMIAQYVGARQLHAEPATILAEPLQFLRLIDKHRVTVAFAPNFLLGQINAVVQSQKGDGSSTQTAHMDLSCLRRIVTGGEANVVETGRRFLELLAPHGLSGRALWPAFGMTETCAASVYSHEFPERDLNNEFASVGWAIEGMEMRIVGENGAAMLAGQTGELQLRGPLIFHRYLNNEAATCDAFTADGWFRTGDLGCLVEGGLTLVARSKDSIIVSGVNYFSHELESELDRLDGIRRSFVAAFPCRPKGADTEQLVVAFATAFPMNDEDRLFQLVVAIRNTTIMLWGFRPVAILALPETAFPKTSLGKIQRSLMRKRFEAGEFWQVANYMREFASRQLGPYRPPEGPSETAIAEAFARVLGLELTTVGATANFFDLGGTSLDILKLTHELQQRFNFKAGVSTILQAPTVRLLAQEINSGNHTARASYDPIVPLQLTGRKTPLFCVHPGNGEILALVNLAKYFLNDRPFYALRARGFNAGEECHKSLDEIVRTYLMAIVRRQPHGPYVLAGYSLGFAIAFEIAKELERRGEQVAFLGCVDGYPYFEPAPLSFNMTAGLAVVLGLINAAEYQAFNAEWGPTPPTAESCQRVLNIASRTRIAQLDMDPNRFLTWAKVACSLEDMVYRHATSGRVRRITTFFSDGLVGWFSKTEWRDLLNRWSEFADGCKHVPVQGNHHTVMSPKHVASFQATFRAEIDYACGDS